QPGMPTHFDGADPFMRATEQDEVHRSSHDRNGDDGRPHGGAATAGDEHEEERDDEDREGKPVDVPGDSIARSLCGHRSDRIPRTLGDGWPRVACCEVSASIAAKRLRAHRLASNALRRPVDVVRWFGAVQAQEYQVAKWALGQRSAP